MGLKKSILVKISPPFLGVAQFAKLIPVALVPLTVFIVDKFAISSTMSTVHRFDPYRIRTVLYLCTMQFSSKIVEEFLKIYPNPANTKLYIQFEDATINHQGKLINTIGQTVLEFNSNEINTAAIPDGIYLLQIDTNKTYTKKIIIKH